MDAALEAMRAEILRVRVRMLAVALKRDPKEALARVDDLTRATAMSHSEACVRVKDELVREASDV